MSGRLKKDVRTVEEVSYEVMRKVFLMVVAVVLLGMRGHAEVMGVLEQPSNFDRSSYSTYIDYGVDLASQDYVVRLPANYDPQKQYGLITFINSTKSGGPKGAWTSVLDELDLIWVGGTNINNSVDPRYRRGVAMMGAFRAMEKYNIDPERVYTMGSSGGARAGMALGFMRPDVIKGVISNVGIVFPEDLPDKFIIDDRNGDRDYYEYGSWSFNLSAIRPLAHQASTRFALMSYYTDYRVDETLNCFHLGMVNHGNQAKQIIRPGAHGGSDTGGFRDAIHFIEHPQLLVVSDQFDNSAPADAGSGGEGWTIETSGGGSVEEVSSGSGATAQGYLRLTPNGGKAAVCSLEKRPWFDVYGGILDFSLRPSDAGVVGQVFDFSLEAESGELLRLAVSRPEAGKKEARFYIDSVGGQEKEVFRLVFDDGDEPSGRNASDPSYFGPSAYVGGKEVFRGLDVRVEVWDSSFQITFGQDIDRSEFTPAHASTVLLKDQRTVTGRWAEVGLTNDAASFNGKNVRLKLEAGGADGWDVDFVEWMAGSEEVEQASLQLEDDKAVLFVPEFDSILIDVLANDQLIESNGALSLVAVDGAQNGIVSIEGGQVRYTPNEGYFGNETIMYTVSGGGESGMARVSVEVFDSNLGNVFTDFGASEGNICDATNWRDGLPGGGNPGVVTRSAFWWPGESLVAPGTGSTSAGANLMSGYVFDVLGTAEMPLSFMQSADFIPEWKDCEIGFEHVTVSVRSGRVLRLSGTSEVRVGIGALVELGAGKNIEYQNDGEGAAHLVIVGGTVRCETLGLTTDNRELPIVSFGLGQGELNLQEVIDFTGDENTYIDFLRGSGGRLSIAAADLTYYEGLWANGNLRINGLARSELEGAPALGAFFSYSGGVLELRDLYAEWQQVAFTSAEIAAGDAAPSADVDGDRLSNLSEYAFGLDPKVSNILPIESGVENGVFYLTLAQPMERVDVSVVGQESEDLVDWVSVPAVRMGDGGDVLRVESLLGERRFLRFQVRGRSEE
ncbi:Ig-like domain-containing protein [Rubritalea tangerina]|uniref:Ig-like domain-containing protein n=1 Tax=Rubritalea tangerina TaxID=430798 RepID=A0ABW4Z9M8_9BACT